MEKKTVLVTGGAGFIGSFVCEAMLREGNRVICVDNFSTGHIRNIEGLLRNPDFQFLRLDINENFNFETFPELEPFKVKFLGIQEIYHLAVPTTVKGYDQFKMQILLANSVGTRNILEVAVKYKSKILLASAATVYGPPRPDGKGILETELGLVDHMNSRAALNEGKRFAETMFSTYADVYGLDAKIARIFRTYGPRMPLFHGHQIPDFVLNILDNKNILVMGDANTTTALVYVSDIVDGMLRLMRAEKGIGPVNLGSDQNLKIADVAKKIMQLSENEVGIDYEPPHPGMIPLGLPNLMKAKEELGWLPLVRLDDGLEKTINYVRANKLLLTGAQG